MGDSMNEQYLMNHYEIQRTRFMDAARQARLKAEVLKNARQQKPLRSSVFSILMRGLRSLRDRRPVPGKPTMIRDHAGLETTLSS